MEEVDTPYVALAVCTLVNASDPDDIKQANAGIVDDFVQVTLKLESR